MDTYNIYSLEFNVYQHGNGVAVAIGKDAAEAFNALKTSGIYNSTPDYYVLQKAIVVGVSEITIPTLVSEAYTSKVVIVGPKGDKGEKGDSGSGGAGGDSLFSKGEGTTSVILKAANDRAVSSTSMAVGENSIAGARGYYWKYFKVVNNEATVYLTNTYGEIVDIEPSIDTTFINPYTTNDYICFRDGDDVYLNKTVTAVSYNTISFLFTDTSFTPHTDTENPKRYHIWCWNKPNPVNCTATVDLGKSSFVAAQNGKAYGKYSAVFGFGGQAIGVGAFSEGGEGVAKGDYSHTEGNKTIANNLGEHAEGLYNKSNTKTTGTSEEKNAGTTISSVGIGASDNTRKNAFEIMQNGDIYVYGEGNYDGTNAGETEVSSLQELLESSRAIYDSQTKTITL